MNIELIKAILHVLDPAVDAPILSEAILPPSEDALQYLAGHAAKCFASDEAKACTLADDSAFLPLLWNIEDDFEKKTAVIAGDWFRVMQENPAIPAGDAAFLLLEIDGAEYLAALKLNYKPGWLHYCRMDGGPAVNEVVRQGTVLPVLVMSFFLAKLETSLHKITPSWLDNLTTPLISILVCGFVTFLAVGPIMRTAGNLLAFGISWLYHSLGFIGGGLFGLFYAPIVLTGMHHSFIAIETQLLAETAVTGGSFIFVTASMNNVAQGAAVLAVLATTKDSKLKSLCSASGISALLGITEPAMFGVNLKLKTPFYAAIIGSAVGSAYVAFHHVLAVALGAAGLPGFISIRPADWLHFAIGLALSMVTAFILTLVFTKKQQNPTGNTKPQTDKRNALPAVDNQTLLAPAAGMVKPIEQSTDGTFSEKLMGDGFVVFPTCGEVCAPINGTVKFIFPTKHAIGLVNEDGVEMLIHMGINTVSLNGEPFTILVQEGQNVRAGEPLAIMNLKQIEDEGCSTEICCIFTAPTPFHWTFEGEAAQAQPIITLGDKQ